VELILIVSAVGLVLLGAVIRSARKIWTKTFQDANHPRAWKNRPAALTAIQMTVAATTFFIWSVLSGGPQIEGSLTIFVSWLVAAGLLQIFNMHARTALQGLKGLTLSAPVEAFVPLAAIAVGLLFNMVFPFKSWARFPLNVWGLLGIVLMVVSLYSLDLLRALKKEQPTGAKVNLLSPFVALRENPALLAVVLVVILGGVGVNIDAELAQRANVPWALAWIAVFAAAGNYLRGWRNGEFADLAWRDIAWVAAPGTLFAVGNGITNYAFRLANTAFVAALKRSETFFSIIGGRFINKETEQFDRRLFAGILMVLGAALVVIGTWFS